MIDPRNFELRIDELVRNGSLEQAEQELLATLTELEIQADPEALGLLHERLAFFYLMPGEKEDQVKAEQHFLKWETLSPEPHTLLQTATFYFYVREDLSKTIAKVDEIRERFDVARNASYYSSLTLKGESLVRLDRVDEADQVLQEMVAILTAAGPGRGRPCGDEINFLRSAISRPALNAHCRQLLELIIPRIMSVECVQQARGLLNQLSTPSASSPTPPTTP